MSEAPIPAEVEVNAAPLRSWYFEKATDAVLHSGTPETQQLLTHALEKIEQEGIDNLTVFS